MSWSGDVDNILARAVTADVQNLPFEETDGECDRDSAVEIMDALIRHIEDQAEYIESLGDIKPGPLVRNK